VLCHGWTVDGEGRTMHKSLGNGVDPADVIAKYGADLCRLWAASADFRLDMRASDAGFKQLSDKYLKIRNTARFILGNLDGFDPSTNMVAREDMLPPDQWALSRCAALIEKCLASYEKYEFWSVTYAIHNFCVVDMSNIYLDIVKDRLYCEAKGSLPRYSAQSAMWLILDAMVRLLAPILAFTANEIWLAMPHRAGDDERNVMLNDMPSAHEEWKLSEEETLFWEDSLKLRNDVNKALELARAEKIIGKPLEAKVTIHVDEPAKKAMERVSKQHFEALFIVSEAELKEGAGQGWAGVEMPGVTIQVEPSTAEKCPRCWTHSPTVGQDDQYPELCARCARALKFVPEA
jgi:isoleucyl-tRNA synthetase